MSTKERVLSMLRMYVEEDLKEDPDKVRLSAKFNDIGVDSLAAIEFVFQLEEAFNMKLDSNDMKEMTVGDVIALVERQLAERSAAAAA